MLVHVLDGTSPDALGDYRALRTELELFNPLLADKPQVGLALPTIGCLSGPGASGMAGRPWQCNIKQAGQISSDALGALQGAAHRAEAGAVQPPAGGQAPGGPAPGRGEQAAPRIL